MKPLNDIRSNNWHDLMIKLDKEYKERSREHELDFLKMDFPDDLRKELVEKEQKERKCLDDDIRRHRQKLLE